MYKFVVLFPLIAVAFAAPSGLPLVAPLTYAAPVVSKSITYASEPVVTGYSSTILKPKLEEHAPLLKTVITEPHAHVEYREPYVAKVGHVVESVPTAVSHTSSTIVHSKANVITPIVAPVIKTYSEPIIKTVAVAPVIKTYSEPIIKTIAAAPIIKTYSEPIVKTVAATPFIGTYSAATPLLKTYTTGPVLSTYAHTAPVFKTFSAPLTYSGYSSPILRSW